MVFNMFYPYCIIDEKISVVHTPLNRDNSVVVHFEEPDEIYGFKTMDCMIPSYRVSNIIGFSEQEVRELVTFCRHNAGIILNVARQGGIANAEYI